LDKIKDFDPISDKVDMLIMNKIIADKEIIRKETQHMLMEKTEEMLSQKNPEMALYPANKLNVPYTKARLSLQIPSDDDEPSENKMSETT